ncbi:hypothetical protein ACU686_17645 [Yinghuangia aomiensis]
MTATPHAIELVIAASRGSAPRARPTRPSLLADVREDRVGGHRRLRAPASAPNDRQVERFIVERGREERLRELGRSNWRSRREGGRRGGPLGAARLHRHRRARPARRGARLLERLEGLREGPSSGGDRAARVGAAGRSRDRAAPPAEDAS